jgi:hypothetical protein
MVEEDVRPSSVKRGGRPKGNLNPQTQRILDCWDATRQENPKLNHEALLNLAAEAVFGSRLNPRVKKKERDRLRRTLQRYEKW